MKITFVFALLFVFLIGVTVGAVIFQPVTDQPVQTIHNQNFESQEPAYATQTLDGNSERLESVEDLLRNEIDERHRLEERFLALESRLDKLELDRPQALGEEVQQSRLNTPFSNTPRPARSGIDVEKLLSSGVDSFTANQLLRNWNRYQLDQLELRDRAAREGWLDSEEFRLESEALREGQTQLRDEIGDQQYDQYLYLTGRDNRVLIDSVIVGSAAENSGLQSGDLILSYAGKRLFTSRQLRNSTREGVRGESVSLQVKRNDEVMEFSVPRGPLGIMMDSVSIEPR